MGNMNESPETNTALLMNKVEEEFQGDPMYKKVISFNLKGKLFSELDLLESIDFTKHYSTKEAASFLGYEVKEYRLTNTLSRESLFPYFRVTRKGSANRYVYDWKAIWRFKMVFLLADAGGMKLVELEKLLGEPFIQKSEEKQMSVDAKFLKGEKVEVIIVSETLDALKKEIENNKRFFQEAMEEMKVAASQRESENFSSIKEVLIQEYTHQNEFLEKIEEQVKIQLKRKRRRSIWNINVEDGEPYTEMFEGMLALVNNQKELLNKKVESLKKEENNSLAYHPKSRIRSVRNQYIIQS